MKRSVVVIDDSRFIRRVVADWLAESDEFELVGQASNGQEGLQLVKDLNPDIVTLDVEMPVMNGLECLEQIMKSAPRPVLMVSSITTQGATATIKALELGAYDVFAKPEGSSSIAFKKCKDDLLNKLRTASRIRRHVSVQPRVSPVGAAPKRTDKVVVIAASTGGPRSLTSLFSSLPKGFSAPVFIVQHMPEGFTTSFAARLNDAGPLMCREARDGDTAVPGVALLAPGGKHMFVGKDGHIRLEDGPNLHGVKPAADHLFVSASRFWGSRLVGVVLTGMGKDGAEGAAKIRQAGGYVLAESEETAVVYGMPKAAEVAGGVDQLVPLHQMASEMTKALTGGFARAS